MVVGVVCEYVCIVLYCILYCIVLYCIVLYCIVLYIVLYGDERGAEKEDGEIEKEIGVRRERSAKKDE